MIPVSAIDHVNITVSDLERARDFYVNTFGFRVLEDEINPSRNRRYIIVGADRVAVALHPAPEVSSGADNDGFVRPGRANHWGFVVGDLDRARAALIDAGVTLRFDGEIIAYPGSRSLYIEDPDGHEIELSEVHAGGLL